MDENNSGWVKLDVCGVENCRSRRYRYDEGRYVCQRGHVYSGTVTANEEDEEAFGPSGKSYKRQLGEVEKAKHYFEGRRAFEHYLLCYQLILRKQLWFLIQSQKLPAELETVVIELWALRLSNLQDRVPDTSEADGESQLYSSQSEGSSAYAETDVEDEENFRHRGRKANSSPSLLGALGLCYLGMQCLRLPFTLGDILRWVASNELVYYRAVKCVPPEMTSKLPAQYHRALDPNNIIKPRDLQKAVLDLVMIYQGDHQIHFPPLNRPLLLFRLVQELALPLEIYAATSRLGELLGYNFSMPGISSRKIRDIDIPEIQLISVLIVAVKLLYPFDGFSRHPVDVSEPAAVAVNWKLWSRRAKHFNEVSQTPKGETYEDLMKVSEADVFSMGESELDKYLDFYQQNWADEAVSEQEKDADFRKAMFTLFPAEASLQGIAPLQHLVDDDVLPAARRDRLRGVQQDLVVQRPITAQEANDFGESVARPGSHYRHYRRAEEIPDDAKVFFDEAARLIGVSLPRLVKAVFATERKLARWKVQERMQNQDKDEQES